MANGTLPPKIDSYHRFDGGIAPYDKETQDNQYAFGRSIDYRTNPKELKLLPKTVKESGNTIENLIKDGDRVNDTMYLYDAAGNIYTRSLAGSYAKVRTVSNSHGNGMKYFGEDDYLYYTGDKLIGRYGQVNGTPSFSDDFLGSEGGVPLNTHALDLEASSSQYASRADTASLSITSDIAIEAYVKLESLPAVGSSMVIASKWNTNGNIRSYKFDILGISGYFGDGSDGALTISSNTTEAPIDSACTGTSGAYSLSATNASFATGQIILIHQSRGTGAGTWQRNKIAGYTAGTITLESALNATYISGAQVRVLKQYTDVTVNLGFTYTAKAWDGTVGGILSFLASGTVTVTGSTSASQKGFRGGAANGTGEGTAGASITYSEPPAGYFPGNNGNGGGVGQATNTSSGAGGGNGTPGSIGGIVGGSTWYGFTVSNAQGGVVAGTADLTTMVFGGGGGGSSGYESGGTGGGIVFLIGTTVTITGSITSTGGSTVHATNSAGAGAGGSVLVKAQTATLGAVLITASGGTTSTGSATTGGVGGVGRIHLDYYTSYTGTTTPTLDVTQDNTLVTTTSYQLRLSVSSNGTNSESLARTVSITTALWYRMAVSWDASDAQAEFFLDGLSQGTSTGTLTSINDNASTPAIGCSFGAASAAENFLDGKIDDVRIWNTERTAAQLFTNKDIEIAGTSVGLAAYWQLDNGYTDTTSNANDLSATNAPVFTTDVPFSSPTTRLDLDQSLDTSGDVYALTTAISETAVNRQTYVPQKDPQKSIEFNISDAGDDADWTVVIHDSLNRVVASKTVAHADIHLGDFEFVFTSTWRPVRGASYHAHIYGSSTTGAPAIVSTTNNDMETADFHTYYQFLVEDTEYHPVEQMLNFMAFGNERYLATYDVSSYNPHRLVLPAGWKIRCLEKWNGYLALGCVKGDSVSDYDEGAIFLWDGYAPTYNDFVPVAEGAVNAMKASRGILYVWAGYQGDMLGYVGGQSAKKLRQLPKMDITKELEVMPKAVGMWQGLLRWGVAGECDSTLVERGVYTYGQKDEEQPVSLSYDYPISTGTRTSTGVKIGFIFPVNKKLLIGWQDNVSYGVDVVDPAGSPFTSGVLELDIKDFGGVWKEKSANVIRAEFKPLLSGESMRLKYKLNRESAWVEGVTDNQQGYSSTADDTFVRMTIPKGLHREVQIALEYATSVSTSPTALELALEEDLKSGEQGL